ncbi:MAG: alpha/beta hydrolase [Nocardioides sp.]|uniref:alpha/beta fold hydrolase n=1 Tax=Nocardioides sp. TaxID=35761 RepID=UPI0039E3EF7E
MRLETFEWGDPSAPPLVCIHGVGGSHGMFDRVARERWGTRFRVVAFDLRGHGDSSWAPPWTNATYVQDIIDTIDDLGLDQPDWVGISFGGRLLLEILAQHPDRVHRAAVLEPVIQASPELASRRAHEELTAGTWDSLEAFFGTRWNTGDVDMARYVESYAGHFETLPDGRVRRRTCQPALVSIFSEMAIPAARPEEITRPTLLLYAPAFGLVTPEQRAAFEPHVSRVVEVPGQHAVLISAYEETASAVEDFLTADDVAPVGAA